MLEQTHCGAPSALPNFELFLWSAVDPAKTLSNWSLSLSTSDSSIVDFTGVWINNPEFAGVPRFEFVFDSSAESVSPLTISTSPADRIESFQAFTIDPAAASGLHSGNADDSSGGSSAWLVATIGVQPLASGSTDAYLQIGSRGLNNLGETTSTQLIFLGRADDVTYIATQQFTLSGDTPDARWTIHDVGADFNLDGAADREDFRIWEDHWSLAYGADCRDGDADHDADVDGEDWLIWQSSFAPFAPLAIPIPEASSILLALSAVVLESCTRRRVGAARSSKPLSARKRAATMHRSRKKKGRPFWTAIQRKSAKMPRREARSR